VLEVELIAQFLLSLVGPALGGKKYVGLCGFSGFPNDFWAFTKGSKDQRTKRTKDRGWRHSVFRFFGFCILLIIMAKVSKVAGQACWKGRATKGLREFDTVNRVSTCLGRDYGVMSWLFRRAFLFIWGSFEW
jgi:hypothetical protein